MFNIFNFIMLCFPQKIYISCIMGNNERRSRPVGCHSVGKDFYVKNLYIRLEAWVPLDEPKLSGDSAIPVDLLSHPNNTAPEEMVGVLIGLLSQWDILSVAAIKPGVAYFLVCSGIPGEHIATWIFNTPMFECRPVGIFFYHVLFYSFFISDLLQISKSGMKYV